VATLEEQFRGRKLPTQPVQLPADPDEFGRITRALSDARWALEEARTRNALDTVAERAKISRLETELDSLRVIEFTLTAIPPDEWEDLVAAHPPTPENLAIGHQWNTDTFRPALLAVSVAGGEAPDWTRLAKEGLITAGELASIFDAAVMLNIRGLSVAVGKGR
jgi:hypothetical protein